MDAIELRLERLELENRRLRRLVLFVGLAAALLFAVASVTKVQAQATPTAGAGTAQVQELDLIDSSGNVRAILSATDQGPLLAFLDAHGGTQMELDPSSVTYWDGKGGIRAQFGLSSTGTPYLSMSDANGNLQSILMEQPDGTDALAFRAKDGTLVQKAP